MQIADDAVRSSRPKRNGLVARVALGLALTGATAVAAYPLVGGTVLGHPGSTGRAVMAAPVAQSTAAVGSDSTTASASLAAPDASEAALRGVVGGLVALPGSTGGATGDARSADQPAPSPTALAGAASSTTSTAGTALSTDTCNVRPTVPADGFDPYYTQMCVVGGIPMLGSVDVDGRALVAAARIVTAMLAPRPDLRAQLVAHHMRVGVLGQGHKAVDLPEYRDLPAKYPTTDWNAARAYSATPARPLMTSPEENLVCSNADTYPGQQVMVHEMGHSVMDLAVRYIDSSFWGRVQQAYDQSMAAGRWVGYYGGSSATEYWAEGVQAYFNASRATPGPDPLGTPVDTREKLTEYDPVLTGLIREVFTDSPWRASCP